MTVEETRNRILTDEKFILDECRRIQTLYELKKVIRYNLSREEEIDTESVAEHIFAMHALCVYFLPLENLEGEYNLERIFLLSEFHDIDEIETGDFVSYKKTSEQIAAGKAALPKVIARLPASMQASVTDILDEYETQKTLEAKFVKAIDKLEPSFHVYSEHGMIINHNITRVTYEQHCQIKDPYTKPFPIVHRFSDVLSRALRDEGFFAK